MCTGHRSDPRARGRRCGEYAAGVIVVIGQPRLSIAPNEQAVDGLAARIALAAAGRGRSVQLIGKVGEDAAGDAVVQALARGGVSHAALLRDAGITTATVTAAIGDRELAAGPIDPEGVGERVGESAPQGSGASLEAADLELGLRYLVDFAVLVLAEPAAANVMQVVADAAAWGETRLIVVVDPGAEVPDGLPADAIVFEAPDLGPEDAFASMVGSFAAALDVGEDPAQAFQSSIETDGWKASPDG